MENGEAMESPISAMKRIKTQTISKIMAGEQAFSAWGYSTLRVVRGDDIIDLQIPIKSIGLAEVMEEISRGAPIPPKKRVTIRKNSTEGKELGLDRDQIMEIEDLTDPKFVQDRRSYNAKSAYKLILYGLAVDITDESGTVFLEANSANSATKLIDEDKALQVLRQQGLSNDQFDQLYEDIRNLTRKEMENVDQD